MTEQTARRYVVTLVDRPPPTGYAVESEREPGSVQIYPEKALEWVNDQVRI